MLTLDVDAGLSSLILMLDVVVIKGGFRLFLALPLSLA